MPRHALLIAALICSLIGVWSCASAPPPEPEAPACEDCIQPPLRRAELLVHLAAEQATIAQRMSYTGNAPRPITEIAHGPTPEHPHREPAILESAEGPYQGRLGWHTVSVDPVNTEGIAQRRLRGRATHAAHCFFAERPNAHSPIFALFTTHDARQGDILYVGRHDIDLARVKVALDHKRAPIRVVRTEQRCAFRDDQNLAGAIVFSYTRQDLSPPENGPFFGVVLVSLSEVRYPTGKTATVEWQAAGGRFAGDAETRQVQIEHYEAPTARLIGPFASEVAAMEAAEAQIPAGRFRLRPEHTFVRMPPQSYLGGQPDEFCPVRANCEVEEPRQAPDEVAENQPETTAISTAEDSPQSDAEAEATAATDATEEPETEATEEPEAAPPKAPPAPRVAPDTPAPSSAFPTRP
ncbi:hypothetical protein DL240_10430 [Lujinxingia litoralis]|uniref:Uncharacterized protein n=1 Tax=Lujinxingia litoralis TaxID=2211119 RepID=A0A328C4L3_9DELT|nr:hypothetical protein [Lujinxingia litoralis]RAL22261.1 hypothetical protein DL240_10430 [Lujinxingia litoralis]